MPLYEDARELIRINLERIQSKVRVGTVAIGTLTETQLASINDLRRNLELTPIIEEIIFVGGHIYKSRIERDGYTIPDVVDQICSALSDESVLEDSEYSIVLINPTARADRYGNRVTDKIVLECTARYPKPELYSVIPKGDRNKPPK